jgi:hypothetical protein
VAVVAVSAESAVAAVAAVVAVAVVAAAVSAVAVVAVAAAVVVHGESLLLLHPPNMRAFPELSLPTRWLQARTSRLPQQPTLVFMVSSHRSHTK